MSEEPMQFERLSVGSNPTRELVELVQSIAYEDVIQTFAEDLSVWDYVLELVARLDDLTPRHEAAENVCRLAWQNRGMMTNHRGDLPDGPHTSPLGTALDEWRVAIGEAPFPGHSWSYIDGKVPPEILHAPSPLSAEGEG